LVMCIVLSISFLSCWYVNIYSNKDYIIDLETNTLNNKRTIKKTKNKNKIGEGSGVQKIKQTWLCFVHRNASTFYC